MGGTSTVVSQGFQWETVPAFSKSAADDHLASLPGTFEHTGPVVDMASSTVQTFAAGPNLQVAGATAPQVGGSLAHCPQHLIVQGGATQQSATTATYTAQHLGISTVESPGFQWQMPHPGCNVPTSPTSMSLTNHQALPTSPTSQVFGSSTFGQTLEPSTPPGTNMKSASGVSPASLAPSSLWGA